MKVAGWPTAHRAESKTIAVITALLRRSLPLNCTDVLQLLEWLALGKGPHNLPFSYATKCLERYAATNAIDAELKSVAERFATVLRQSYNNDAKRLATAVDQLCASIPQQDGEDEPGELRDAPAPSAAGNPLVLLSLKIKLGTLPADASAQTTPCGPDRYEMLTDSPLASAHALLAKLLDEKVEAVKWGAEIGAFPTGQAILGLDANACSKILMAAMERHMASLLGQSVDYSDPPLWKAHSALPGIVTSLGREPLDLNRELLFDLILYLAMRPYHMSPRGAKFSEESDGWVLERVRSLTNDDRSLTEGER